MNWEALGAIGEIAGAIGVIVTLLYLSAQIRESNRSARHTGTQEILNQALTGIRQQSIDPDGWNLWIRGHMADPSLTPEELSRFRVTVMQNVMIWERAFYLRSEGRIDESLWDTLKRHRSQIIMSKGFKAYFDDRKHLFSDGFRVLIEKEIEDAADQQWSPQGVEEAKSAFATASGGE